MKELLPDKKKLSKWQRHNNIDENSDTKNDNKNASMYKNHENHNINTRINSETVYMRNSS